MIKMSRTINLPESIPADVKKAIMDLNATTHDELMSANTTSQKETITSDYTIPDSGLDSTYFVDLAGASADVNVTLPLMANNTGRKITIMVISEHASAYKCIVSPHATDANKLTTDGLASMWLPLKGNIIELQENQTVGYWLSLHERITSLVELDTYAGYGSTDLNIVKLTNKPRSLGNMFTDNHGAYGVHGYEATIQRSGLYAVTLNLALISSYAWGLSVNSNQLTTNVYSITLLHRKALRSASSSEMGMCSYTDKLVKGDVVRIHGDRSTPATANYYVKFNMVYLGN